MTDPGGDEGRDLFADKADWFDRMYDSPAGQVRFRVLSSQMGECLPPPPASVLDAGAGPGRYAAALAGGGYHVTLLDPSGPMLDRAKRAVAPHADQVRLELGRVEEAADRFGANAFDVVLLHAVVCYVHDLDPVLAAVSTVLRRDGLLSLVFKNRSALAMRHVAGGDLDEATRVLDDPREAGRLGIVNRARARSEVEGALARHGFVVRRAWGLRIFTDLVGRDLSDADVDRLVELELRGATTEPYRSVGRLWHLACERDTATADREPWEVAAAAPLADELEAFLRSR